MMTLRNTLILAAALTIAACSRPDPEAASAEPQAPAEAEGEATTEFEAEPEREEGTNADEPVPSAWSLCPPELVETVRSYPLFVDGVETTLGARVDAGAVSAAIDLLDSSFSDGVWMCRAEGGLVAFEYRAFMNAAEFGPRWFTPTPDQLEPVNLLAEAVNGVWTPTPGDEARVRNTLLRCRFGSGHLTSGAFIHIINDETRDPAATDLAWSVIPHERRGSVITYRAVLDWPSADGRAQATWIVSPGSSECEPADELAGAIHELASGVPSHGVELRASSPTPSNRPSTQQSERGRTLAYAFAEERELATIADWLEFHSRLTPYETREWEVEARADSSGTRLVSMGVVRERDPAVVAYRVNQVTGESTTASPLTALARGVLPRRAVGVGDVSTVPVHLPQEQIDETLAGNVSGLAACLNAAEASAMSFAWSTAWDGHAYGVQVTPADPDLVECMTELLEGIQFPRFSGPPMSSTSEISLVQ